MFPIMCRARRVGAGLPGIGHGRILPLASFAGAQGQWMTSKWALRAVRRMRCARLRVGTNVAGACRCGVRPCRVGVGLAMESVDASGIEAGAWTGRMAALRDVAAGYMGLASWGGCAVEWETVIDDAEARCR